MPDALLEELCICGSQDVLRERFVELNGLGFNEVIIGPPFGSNAKKTIATFSPGEA